jgi:alginate O-acetyltransferase complex protein AlgI
MGFVFPQNFDRPYRSASVREFWRRWHMTLSRFLRDFLYIPLGGNRGGRWFVARNLMLTMVLGGLWHGAAWTFVVWGGLHGSYLAVERWLKARFAGWTPGPAAIVGLGLLTYVLVNLTWVFFRAKTFGGAATMLTSMAGMADKAIPMIALLPMIYALVIVGGIVGTHWWMRDKTLEIAVERTPSWLVAALLATMAVAVVAEQGKGSAFIYFQF